MAVDILTNEVVDASTSIESILDTAFADATLKAILIAILATVTEETSGTVTTAVNSFISSRA